MDITTILGIVSSVAVFAAWFVLPARVEAPPAVELPETGLVEAAA